VYQHVSGSYLGGHAIKLLGWGVDKATGAPYWLCANSWNEDWSVTRFSAHNRGRSHSCCSFAFNLLFFFLLIPCLHPSLGASISPDCEQPTRRNRLIGCTLDLSSADSVPRAPVCFRCSLTHFSVVFVSLCTPRFCRGEQGFFRILRGSNHCGIEGGLVAGQFSA